MMNAGSMKELSKVMRKIKRVPNVPSYISQHPSLRIAVLAQYKALLVQANHLFDANARIFVANRIRARFRDNQFEVGAKRVSDLLRIGQTWLGRLKRANLGDWKAFDRVLYHTYGRIGKRKHQLLQPYYGFNPDTKTPTIMAQDRSQPPVIPEPIWELMKRDPNVKHKFEVDNPPIYKGMPPKREINQMWRHYMRQSKKLQAPLPLHEVQHLQDLARTATSSIKRTEFQLEWEKEAHEKRRTTGRFEGTFHVMSSRFLRRRYRLMLEEYIPMITRDEGGSRWKIEQAVNPVKDNYPPIPERHLNSFKFGFGVEGGSVDSKGAFIQPPSKKGRVE